MQSRVLRARVRPPRHRIEDEIDRRWGPSPRPAEPVPVWTIT